MTTIAYRNGVLAADSCATTGEADGAYQTHCRKLFRKKDAIIATSGESSSGMVFVDWYGGKVPPDKMLAGGADFICLVLTRSGLFEYDKWCRGEKILQPFYAIGTGAKAALSAMHAGSSAQRAVEIACMLDPYSKPPVVTMRLKR